MHGFLYLLRGPQHRKGPKKGSQGSASVYMLFSLSNSQPCALPCSVCSALFHRCFLPHVFSLRLVSYYIFHPLFFPLFLFLSLLLVNVDDIDFPTTEPRLQITGSKRGFTFPENSIYPTCSAVMPGIQAKFFGGFFLPRRGSTAKMQCAQTSKGRFS